MNIKKCATCVRGHYLS